MTDEHTLTLSEDEMWIVCNALNEALHGPDSITHPGEFSARIGATKDEVRDLHERMLAMARPPR